MSERKMYERVFGPKYEETKHLGHDYAAIAKLVRTDIREAVRLGLLPGAVTDYHVRSERYSGGGSINVRVVNHADLWQDCDGFTPDGYVCQHPWCAAKSDARPGSEIHQRYTAEGAEVKKLLEWLLKRYNYDGSESQVDYFDVRYYGTVEIYDARSMEYHEREAARLAQNKLDAAAKKEVIAKLVPHGYKAGRLRTASLEKLEALLAKIEG